MNYNSFVEFSLMASCPNICKYCPQDVLKEAYVGANAMSLANFKIAIDKLPPSVISFAGFCEPFMNPDIMEMIEYATSQNHAVIIYTTLMGMTIDRFDTLMKNSNVRQMVIHLPDSAGNTKIRISESYKELLKYIVANPASACNMVIKSIHGANLHPDIQNLITVYSEFKIHDRAGSLKSKDPAIHKIHHISGKIKCDNGFRKEQSGLILPNGDVHFCCMDFGLKYKIGNILTDTWDKIMASPVRARIFKDRITGEYDLICRHCSEACQDFSI